MSQPHAQEAERRFWALLSLLLNAFGMVIWTALAVIRNDGWYVLIVALCAVNVGVLVHKIAQGSGA